jgi:diacylglycerol kinase (ATP)
VNPSSIKRVLLIVNPAARSAAARGNEALRAFVAAGVQCDMRVTEHPGHAGELSSTHASDYDAVFTLGGDGTAVEVLGALAGGGPPVGILPGGTGNVIARALKTPMSISRAVPALLAGRESRLDMGLLGNGRHFVIGVGVGVDAEMIAGASKGMKKRLGPLAYFVSGANAALRLERFRYRITADGVVHEGETISALVANLGSVLGGLLTLGKHISADDGVLHVVVFKPSGLVDAFRVFFRMLAGTLTEDRSITYIAAKQLRIETMPPRRAEFDGETLEPGPLDITVKPGAARLLSPRR